MSKVATHLDQQARESGSGTDIKGVATSTNQFAFDLYSEFRQVKGNLFFSPSSIANVLAMLHAGARGQTESQLGQALHLASTSETRHAAFARWIHSLMADAKRPGNELRVANALWTQQGATFLRTFLDVAMTHYAAELQHVDFAAPAQAAAQINDWVACQTEQKISKIVSPESISPLMRLVLTNAVHFKGQWKSPFQKYVTQNAPFTLEDGSQTGQVVQTLMMMQKRGFKYAEGDEFQAVELPYLGECFSMTIFLPKACKANWTRNWWPFRKRGPATTDGTELRAFEESFGFAKFERWRPKQYHEEVEVFLPKFKMDWECHLPEVLKSLGVSDAFSPELADFSGITGNRDLFISEGIHKAYVDVNEEGTEAAAVTAFFGGPTCAMPAPKPEPIVFRADHPFLFLIRHIRSDTILFMGRVMDPR